MSRAHIAVVVPTLRRPDSLRRALLSILAQDGAAELAREIVVADNSPEGSAAETVDSLRGGPLPLTYVHAPRPGVATARNAALQATDAPLIAWLDDDEEARPGWLRSLQAAQAMFDADVVFGPIRGRIPD